MPAVDTPEYLAELYRLRELQKKALPGVPADVTAADYVSKCLIVEKETGNLIRFKLWDRQREALDFLVENPFAISVKGRQVGASWILLALMAYEADSGGNRMFSIGRQSEEYAKDAIKRLMYLRGLDPHTGDVLPESPMPPEWRSPIVSKTTTQIVLANGSSLHALTATQRIGRGLAVYRGLMDEFSVWPWQESQRKAMEAGCARLDILSTGSGEGDDFHRTWTLAVEGKGRYRPFFISAEADPRRDADFFRIMVEEDADPEGAAREYARSPEDAFRSPEGNYFRRFTRDNNVREFDVVPVWRTDIGVDWGLRHPAALFLQVSPSGQPFVFDEYLPVDEPRTSEFGQGILGKLAHYVIGRASGVYADPAGKARNQQSKLSDFALFRDLGLSPTGIVSKVHDGCVLLRESIGDPDDDARLIVHPRCVGLIDALTNVRPHRNDPEIYDTDHELYSHPIDGLRYWHVNRYRRRKSSSASSVATSSSDSDRPTRNRVF